MSPEKPYYLAKRFTDKRRRYQIAGIAK